MNRIIELSEEMGWVTIEPGVTQRQLAAYLQERKSRLWLDATGSSPDASIIGNTMERGFGHTPYGDHAAHACALEVMLPSGELVETGMSRFSGAHAAPVYRWGLGPGLDALFMQSNLGIVTRMTVWLMPAPEYFQAFFFRVDDPLQLAPVIDALRPLRLNGTLRSAMHIANDYKVLSGIQQYPWEKTNNATPLTPETMTKLRIEMNFGAWNGSGGIYGTRAQVSEARRLVREALKGKVSRLQFLDERMFELAGRFSKLFGMLTRWDISRALELARPVFGLLRGIPTDRPLASGYWRKRTPPPADMNPDRDGCGLMWGAPVAPASGHHACAIADLATRITLKHGFEPILSFTLITDRALICVVSLSWDRDVPGEDGRARVCYDEMQAAFLASGYPPYRLGIQSLYVGGDAGVHTQLLDAIRDRFDPGRLLAPGRYSN